MRPVWLNLRAGPTRRVPKAREVVSTRVPVVAARRCRQLCPSRPAMRNIKQANIHKHSYVHTYIHTYSSTYILTYLPTYLPT